MNPVFDISIYWIIVANQKDLLYNLSNPSPLTSFKQKTIEFVKHERNFVRKNPGIPVKPPSTGYPKDFKTNWIFMSWSFLRRLVKLFLPEDLRRPTCESFTYFPNWLCFKAFVWALPVHGDDLQIYIYIQCDMDWVKWLICFNWGFYPKQLVWCPGVPTSPSRFLIALLRAFMNRKKQHGSASLA